MDRPTPLQEAQLRTDSLLRKVRQTPHKPRFAVDYLLASEALIRALGTPPAWTPAASVLVVERPWITQHLLRCLFRDRRWERLYAGDPRAVTAALEAIKKQEPLSERGELALAQLREAFLTLQHLDGDRWPDPGAAEPLSILRRLARRLVRIFSPAH